MMRNQIIFILFSHPYLSVLEIQDYLKEYKNKYYSCTVIYSLLHWFRFRKIVKKSWRDGIIKYSLSNNIRKKLVNGYCKSKQ